MEPLKAIDLSRPVFFLKNVGANLNNVIWGKHRSSPDRRPCGGKYTRRAHSSLPARYGDARPERYGLNPGILRVETGRRHTGVYRLRARVRERVADEDVLAPQWLRTSLTESFKLSPTVLPPRSSRSSCCVSNRQNAQVGWIITHDVYGPDRQVLAGSDADKVNERGTAFQR